MTGFNLKIELDKRKPMVLYEQYGSAGFHSSPSDFAQPYSQIDRESFD